MHLARLCAAFAAALATIVTAVASEDLPTTGAATPADRAVWQRIDACRRAAAGLRVDGLDGDWRGLPQLADPRGDAARQGHRDLVTAAIAPTESDLWIMLRTAGSPSTAASTFYVEVDLWGPYGSDFRLELQPPPATSRLRWLRRGQPVGQPVALAQAEVAIRRVVEARVPYRAIEAALVREQAEAEAERHDRPWVRIRTVTWDAQAQAVVDYGPSAASYRLVKTPAALDEPLPERPQPPSPMVMPVEGRWLVLQGPMGSFSHRNSWACDLAVIDATGWLNKPAARPANADYFAWDRSVTSPVEGRVLLVSGDQPDQPAGTALDARRRGNRVYIATADGFSADLVHLKRGSLQVAIGQSVTVGQPLGRVGNSGASDVPHLHLAAWQTGLLRRSIPLALRRVRVGLNPVDDDPWSRELEVWEPREGMVVEALGSRGADKVPR